MRICSGPFMMAEIVTTDCVSDSNRKVTEMCIPGSQILLSFKWPAKMRHAQLLLGREAKINGWVEVDLEKLVPYGATKRLSKSLRRIVSDILSLSTSKLIDSRFTK
jgi:hypothetical protein